jgi:hypothetical protein
MIPHTEHPIIEWPEILGQRDGHILTKFRDGTRAFTWEKFLAYHKEREAQIARMADDPYRYGWINPAWLRADQAFTDLRAKFPKGVTEVLILGGNRSGKSRYFARRCMQILVEKPGAKIWCLQSTEVRQHSKPAALSVGIPPRRMEAPRQRQTEERRGRQHYLQPKRRLH